jgi:HlyD family secretion protein
MRKRKKKYLLLLPLLALLAIPLMKGDGEEETAAQVAVARLGSLEERADGSGTLEGASRVEISAAMPGTIEELFVEQGDSVRTGQTLLTLETSQASAGLDQADAQVRSASISLAQAEREQTRIRALRDAGLASLEEATVADEDVQLSQAELERAFASRALAQDDMDNTTCTSPMDGIVTALNVEEGEIAVVGTMNNAGTVLMTIEDMSSFLVRVTMVESEIVDVREGMTAEATLDALPDTVFSGVVERVGLSASNDAGGETAAEYEVLVRLDNPDPRMRSGMSASVEVLTAENDSCVIVPIQCIVEREFPGLGSGTAVLAVEQGRVRVVPVETGVTGLMEIEVEGIAAGDTVISGPTEMLRTLQTGDPLGNASSEGMAMGGENEGPNGRGPVPGPGFMPPGR